MLTMTVLPLIILGVVIIFFTSKWFRQSMNDEVQTELRSVAKAVLNTYDLLYPGDYTLSETNPYILLKGGQSVSDDLSPLDYVKENTGVDVTIFYQDVRLITTLRGDNNERLIGTHPNLIVATEVLDKRQERFYASVSTGVQEYFAYYCPILNSDNSLAGMIATLKPSAEVKALIWRSMLPFLVLLVMETILIGFFMIRFTNGLIDSIHTQQNIMRHIAGGELSYPISPELLKREDEFGNMARSTRSMQRALRNLIEIDYLTTLDNRRSGQNILKKVYDAAKQSGVQFAVSMGDIDHFKRFNDTYGHDCGDLVLQAVSHELKKGMVGKGYAIRWGGEEFLLIFDRTTYEQSLSSINSILDEVRSCAVEYNGEKLSVTMTFSLIKGDLSHSIDEILKRADDMLYEGKQGGRNRIVCQEVEPAAAATE